MNQMYSNSPHPLKQELGQELGQELELGQGLGQGQGLVHLEVEMVRTESQYSETMTHYSSPITVV